MSINLQGSSVEAVHSDGPPLLALKGISKSFPGVRALHNVTMSLRSGEVTALLGENGAGKSTLVKVLTGLYRPDAGEMLVSGRSANFASPRDAWASGIAAIHQETVMFEELSVAENVFMGHMPVTPTGIVDWPETRRRTAQILEPLEANFGPDTPVKRLGIAQRHLLEIARALSHDGRVVIMDEPTAALSAREIDDLVRIIFRLKARGCAILFISHKFEEIFRIADTWVCLRDGEQVGAGEIKDATSADLVRLMVGRSIDQVFPKRKVSIGEPVLEVQGLSNATEFADISFTLRGGEILGFYGLVGAGRSEAIQALFGLSRPTKGTIRRNGEALRIRTPSDAIAAGLAYVPEDRQTQGAILELSITENVTLASLVRYAWANFLSRGRELAETKAMGRRFDVKASSWDQRLSQLSGGNQQKVVIGKWVATDPKILILDEPTKGIDIGSKAAVHTFMGELTSQGVGIILISSELPEVMGMSDTILVMHEGRIVRRFSRDEMTAEEIVEAATGGQEGRA